MEVRFEPGQVDFCLHQIHQVGCAAQSLANARVECLIAGHVGANGVGHQVRRRDE